jgi:uncharacterized protein (TIGR03032 family)
MPHSPRWYAERLWLLESGDGALVTADPETGARTTVARLPGFTRGLAFAGPIAFVGLSQVRESATFGGLPLTERLQDRSCGVWAVDTRTGRTLAYLRFEDGVQEVFAVEVLQGRRFPEMLELSDPLTASTYVLPNEALADVPGGGDA